ncbi:MAG TPA: MerR family DNA-binding transcriptional regulator [Marmoricola sp.]|nr:MerR family DNA-binding transcriptional regulator [Marmoricola sp.]
MGAEARITIGQAVADLKAEFPDVDIRESKIRYLEAEGLIVPDRTPSGYRKYSVKDMEKLRYVIRAQRDASLPLKVIREQLEAIDRGLQPPPFAGEPTIPQDLLNDPNNRSQPLRPQNVDIRISRKELLKTVGISEEALDELIEYGLVQPKSGTRVFDADALITAQVANQLAAYGLQPRHLRAFKAAADREVGMVQQIVEPIRRSREAGAEGRAAAAAEEISMLSVQLHSVLVRSGLARNS